MEMARDPVQRGVSDEAKRYDLDLVRIPGLAKIGCHKELTQELIERPLKRTPLDVQKCSEGNPGGLSSDLCEIDIA
jgi:hypothetical protein